MLKNCLIIILLTLSTALYSQVTIGSMKKPSESAILDLKQVMEDEVTDEEIAYSYAVLAESLMLEGNYEKAILYYSNAKKLYTKMKILVEIAKMDIKIAKVYEQLDDKDKALESYQLAQKLLTDSISLAINSKDILRLQAKELAEEELRIEEKIELLEGINDKESKVEAYQQKAEVKIKQKDDKAALENLNKAKDNLAPTQDSYKIDSKIVDIYIDTKAFEDAENKSLEIITNARATNNIALEIEQLQKLATIYFENLKSEEGFESLQKAYDISLAHNRAIDTKKTVQLLVEKYQEHKNNKAVLAIYEQFVDQLEPLIKNDSTLLHSKIYQFNEERIEQLETERELKDELITRTNRLNYILIASVVIAILFIVFISKTLLAIKKKNKQIALQSLRRQMNPHFIFNSLNSVNQFIMQNDELEANKYLTSYSKLMRNVMQNSNEDFVSLASELEQLKEYLDLEYIRFHNKFEYKIELDKSLDVETILVPNMLIQPQVENAIWHGLRYKKEKGLLILKVFEKDNRILIIVDDDGIGIEKSKSLKTKHQRTHESLGVKNSKERIALLNDLYHSDISITMEEKTPPEMGVVVTLSFSPSKKKKHAK